MRFYLGLVALCAMCAMAARPAFSQSAVITELLELANAERASLDISPLYLNAQLIEAAQRHSDDMARGSFLSHTGSDGSQFWQRVADAGYNMTTGAQSVMVSDTIEPEQVFAQWRNSPGNYSNITNRAYQEVGIAYAQSASGAYYFTMVFGSRADFTPPAPSQPPTITLLPPSATSTPPPSATVLSTASAAPSPTFTATVTEAPAATPTIALGPLTLIQATIQQFLSLWTLDHILSQLARLQPAVAAVPTPTPSLTPTVTPSATSTITPTPTRTPSMTPSPTALSPTLTQTPTPEPDYEIRLIYTWESLTLINTSGGPLGLQGLRFESATGILPVESWDIPALSAPLNAFPDGGCLQAWGLEAREVLPAPDRCEARHAWIAVGARSAFWRDTATFTVYIYGQAVTRCTVALGHCAFNLSDRLFLLGPTATATPWQPLFIGPADLRLIYSPTSFALINTAGRNLDLRGLGFASASGTMVATRWDNPSISAPLAAFPEGDCLQAWPVGTTTIPPGPPECRVRHAWAAVNFTQTFWINTDAFTVSYNGVVVATCQVSAGVCDVDLP